MPSAGSECRQPERCVLCSCSWHRITPPRRGWAMAIVGTSVVEFIEPNADTHQLFGYWEQTGERQDASAMLPL